MSNLQTGSLDYGGAFRVYKEIANLEAQDYLTETDHKLLNRLEKLAKSIDKSIDLFNKMAPLIEKEMERMQV